MPADRDLIAEGREKLAAATPGPWTVHEPEPEWYWVWRQDKLPNWGGVLEPRQGCADHGGGAIGGAIATDNKDSEQERADADLVAWMRNNLPALLDALEAAQRPPLGYLAVNTRSEVVLTKGYWGTLAEATAGWGSSSRATIVELREVQP